MGVGSALPTGAKAGAKTKSGGFRGRKLRVDKAEGKRTRQEEGEAGRVPGGRFHSTRSH